MTQVSDRPTQDSPCPTEPEYLAWRDAKVRKALAAAEQSGRSGYVALDDVAQKFGLNVR